MARFKCYPVKMISKLLPRDNEILPAASTVSLFIMIPVPNGANDFEHT